MMNCNDMSKALRTFRLAEVKATGVDMLVTSCPKCLAHLNCLKHETEREGQEEVEREYNLEIVDLAVFLGRLLTRNE
jgi:Fe-S oxidoreductase